MAWFTLESIFVLTFTAELILRAIFKYQVEVFGEHELIFLVVPKSLAGGTPHGLGDNPALRLVGLVRLVRLVRLLHLIKDLARMVRGFVGNFRLIIRSVCILTLFIYASSVLMVDFVGHNEETKDDAAVQADWGRIPDCMMTLFTMTTLSSWSKQDEDAEKNDLRLYKARKAIHQVMDECFTEMEEHLATEQEKVKELCGFALERVNQLRELHDAILSGRARHRDLLRANGGTLDSIDSIGLGTVEIRANESAEVNGRTTMPEGGGRMSSFEGMEAPVNEEVSLAVSAYDDDNFAEVTRCIWVSEVESKRAMELADAVPPDGEAPEASPGEAKRRRLAPEDVQVELRKAGLVQPAMAFIQQVDKRRRLTAPPDCPLKMTKRQGQELAIDVMKRRRIELLMMVSAVRYLERPSPCENEIKLEFVDKQKIPSYAEEDNFSPSTVYASPGMEDATDDDDDAMEWEDL
eukprot:g12916.t1